MKHPISITALSSISSLGRNESDIWNHYLKKDPYFSTKEFDGKQTYIAKLNDEDEHELELLKNADKHYKDLDKSVLMAVYTARKAVEKANWTAGDFGINIGSSRGATELFEKYHQDFLETRKTNTLTSPTTTLGNISSWIAHDLQTQGPVISHSITCSTALHAVLNGIAWINSGMNDKFLVGGSEAPLTDFTIAQMKALKIYAHYRSDTSTVLSAQKEAYPCKTLDFSKKRNTMILGEGAAMMCLEKGKIEGSLATVIGIGYATEILKHNISISEEAICFQKSMKMALNNTPMSDVDAVVMHAPGTIKGDRSEYNAIQKIFGNEIPAITSNKWKIGHTFGASGALSMELAILMFQNQKFIGIPFLEPQKEPQQLRNILVNAVGFGGNAVSILLSK